MVDVGQIYSLFLLYNIDNICIYIEISNVRWDVDDLEKALSDIKAAPERYKGVSMQGSPSSSSSSSSSSFSFSSLFSLFSLFS